MSLASSRFLTGEGEKREGGEFHGKLRHPKVKA
jgi:hypothetical protein